MKPEHQVAISLPLNDFPGLSLDPSRMPRHVAIVMDGNGRWAQRRGLKRTEGHAAGEEALFDTVEGGLEIDLEPGTQPRLDR